MTMTSPDFEYFKHKTVIVTGGAGFIGSHLCEQLLKLGATVIAVDNLLTGQSKNITEVQASVGPERAQNFIFIQADASQPPESYLPAETSPELILHFASPASPPRYQAHPVETYLINSLGTHHLLQYLLHHHPQARFLFASTSETYGDPQQHPQTESYWGNVNPNGVRSCYDEAKRLGETICGVHYRDFKLDVRIVRIFNTYGPRMDLQDGRVIPNFIREYLQHQPLSIYGDGSQTRSYCYVNDLVEAILRVAASPQLSGETINLGNPHEFTILQTAEVLTKVAATLMKEPDELTHSPQLEFHPLPKDDPTRRQPDITKATQLLGWQPQVQLEDGLRTTIEYFLHQA